MSALDIQCLYMSGVEAKRRLPYIRLYPHLNIHSLMQCTCKHTQAHENVSGQRTYTTHRELGSGRHYSGGPKKL